jgi:hypothetical protein
VFLDVDLEVRSRERLDALIGALGERVVVSRHERSRGRSLAYLLSGCSDPSPTPTLRWWVRWLTALRGEPRRILRASQITVSIGFDHEVGTTSTAVRVAPEDVAALARLGIGIEVVVNRSVPRKRRRR